MQIGYNKDFIGNNIEVPIPRLTPSVEALSTFTIGNNPTFILDYIHYSIIMNQTTKQPIISAFNLDQSKFQSTNRKDNWRRDSRIRDQDQLEDHYYKYNDWDKGHMVMRNNTAWGDTKHEAQIADDESFYYTNAAFQHQNMNRDEWLALEEDVERKFADDANNRLCVFTGPVHSDLDRYYSRTWHDTVRIPSGFFKVICYQNKANVDFNPNGLGVKAFMMFQDDQILKDQKGRKSIKFKEYQVTIKEIEELTGLDFGRAIFDANPLFYYDNEERRNKYNVTLFPERIPIDHIDNVVDYNENRISVDYYNNRKLAIVCALVDPRGSDYKKEWVIIINSSNSDINIDGWVLADNKNRSIQLKGTLSPGETIKIEPDELLPIKLRNSGGDLRIINTDFQVVDYVRWTGNDVRSAGPGQALIFGYEI